MALRSLLCRAETSAHGHLKTKFLGPINNQNLLCRSSSLRRHMTSTPSQGLGTADAVSSNASLPSGARESVHMAGGLIKIDSFVKILAQFAVNEHNAKQNGDLQFVTVVHASRKRDERLLFRIIAEKIDPGAGAENDVRVHRPSDLGTYTQEEDALVRVLEATEVSARPFMHHITLEAIDAGKPKIFKAVVWVEHLRNLLKLYELKPISDAFGIVGIKHQGYSSLEASSSNPIVPASRPFLTYDYYLSQMNFGFVTIPKAATCDKIRCFAQFAVNEHNEKENAQLEFVRVVGATFLRVSGIRYEITLEAKDGGKLKKYFAAVWVQSWIKFMKLTKWELIDDASCTYMVLGKLKREAEKIS